MTPRFIAHNFGAIIGVVDTLIKQPADVVLLSDRALVHFWVVEDPESLVKAWEKAKELNTLHPIWTDSGWIVEDDVPLPKFETRHWVCKGHVVRVYICSQGLHEGAAWYLTYNGTPKGDGQPPNDFDQDLAWDVNKKLGEEAALKFMETL